MENKKNNQNNQNNQNSQNQNSQNQNQNQRKKLTKEDLQNLQPKTISSCGVDYSKMKKAKQGQLRHDKDIVLSDIIQKLYKELWTPMGVVTFLCDYHQISKYKSRNLINEAKSMFYHHLKETKSDIFLDCYNMMMVVAQKAMESEDYKLVLDSTKEIAKLHHLYSEERDNNAESEQPLFAPPQKYEGIDKEDLYIDTDYEDIDDNDDSDSNNNSDNNDSNSDDDSDDYENKNEK